MGATAVRSVSHQPKYMRLTFSLASFPSNRCYRALPLRRQIESIHMICNIISVVDDDPMVRDATVDLLNSYGYTALGFETAEAFLNSGEVPNTCCLITDQQLPGLSGTELQKYLCSAGYRTPIIFITAYPVPTIREGALAAGAIAYLTKPFDEAVLVDHLQSALSIR